MPIEASWCLYRIAQESRLLFIPNPQEFGNKNILRNVIARVSVTAKFSSQGYISGTKTVTSWRSAFRACRPMYDFAWSLIRSAHFFVHPDSWGAYTCRSKDDFDRSSDTWQD